MRVQVQVARINANGMTQISAALGASHKVGKDHFTSGMLHAWAAEAEKSFNNGNGMCFEIKSWDSVTGRTVVVPITTDGYDTVPVIKE